MMTSEEEILLVRRISRLTDEQLWAAIAPPQGFGYAPERPESSFFDPATGIFIGDVDQIRSLRMNLIEDERKQIAAAILFFRLAQRFRDKDGVDRHDSGALPDRTQNLTAHFKALLDEVLTPAGQSELRKIAAGFQNGRPEDLRQFLEVMPRVTADLEPKRTDPIEETTVKALSYINPNVPTSQELAKFTPTEFFEWFNKNLETLPHVELKPLFQTWLTAQAGKTFGSSETTAEIVTQIKGALAACGLALVCPGSKDSPVCGEPARVIFVPDRNKKDKWVFCFKHLDTKQKKHGTSDVFPSVTICKK